MCEVYKCTSDSLLKSASDSITGCDGKRESNDEPSTEVEGEQISVSKVVSPQEKIRLKQPLSAC